MEKSHVITLEKIRNAKGVCLGLYGISAMIAILNYNMAIFLILLITFFVDHEMGLAEYCVISIALMIKSQADFVLSSTDLHSSVAIYNYISSGGSVFDIYDKGEILLPSIYWLFSRFITNTNPQKMSFLFVLMYLIIAYPLVQRQKRQPLLFVSVLVFFDVNLIVHLFRQMISSLFILYVLEWTYKKQNISGKKMMSVVAFAISFLLHLTAVLFTIYGFLAIRIKTRIWKILMILAYALGVMQLIKLQIVIALEKFHGVSILGKSSYALNLLGSAGGVRIIAIIGMLMAFFVEEDDLYLKIFMVFSSLTLLLFSFPILAPRSGLIATSILTGIPIGFVAIKIKEQIISVAK